MAPASARSPSSSSHSGGKGFLTGAIKEDSKFKASDIRNALPRFPEEARQANQALVELLGY
jgi:aryl-alcohol dehydrogenase-like predicted oxidoreductase